MKVKDDFWYEEQIQNIKKRKRKLKHIQDSSHVKKVKGDLKREKRAAKRSSKHFLNEIIKKEIDS